MHFGYVQYCYHYNYIQRKLTDLSDAEIENKDIPKNDMLIAVGTGRESQSVANSYGRCLILAWQIDSMFAGARKDSACEDNIDAKVGQLVRIDESRSIVIVFPFTGHGSSRCCGRVLVSIAGSLSMPV